MKAETEKENRSVRLVAENETDENVITALVKLVANGGHLLVRMPGENVSCFFRSSLVAVDDPR